MKVRAPFTIDHEPTLFMLACLQGDVERWQLREPDDYLCFLTYQWDEGKSFVNIEHDVEFEPSIVMELWECESDWCFAPYEGITEPQLPHLGMAKISSSHIEKTHDVWKTFTECSEVMRLRWQRQPTWSMLDGYLYRFSAGRGLFAHRHSTTVVNRRPPGVVQMSDDSMAGFLHGA
jgi:hypothetical protein